MPPRQPPDHMGAYAGMRWGWGRGAEKQWSGNPSQAPLELLGDRHIHAKTPRDSVRCGPEQRTIRAIGGAAGHLTHASSGSLPRDPHSSLPFAPPSHSPVSPLGGTRTSVRPPKSRDDAESERYRCISPGPSPTPQREDFRDCQPRCLPAKHPSERGTASAYRDPTRTPPRKPATSTISLT